jgi:AcrR family transcriptional regulator
MLKLQLLVIIHRRASCQMLLFRMTIEPAKIDPRIRRTRQMLFQAFQDLLTEKTFDLISVQDIAERSTLNRATFYDHFPDKFALLEAMTGAGVKELITVRMGGNEGTSEAGLRQLILAACDFLAQVSSGCQKHQRQFEPMVESQVKTTIREFLLEDLRNREVNSPELKATMVSWAITGAAMQWSHEKKTTADELADAVLPTVKTALRTGEQQEPR